MSQKYKKDVTKLLQNCFIVINTSAKNINYHLRNC